MMKTTKLIISLLLLGLSLTASAQLTTKEQKAHAKYIKEKVNEKASKKARKRAKELEKEGWKSATAKSLEDQQERYYRMAAEEDDDMNELYLWGTGEATAGHYDGAKMAALARAKQELAGSIQTKVGTLIKTSSRNKETAAEDATTLLNYLDEGKQFINENLGRTIVVIERYQTLPNKNKIVRVEIAYSLAAAKQTAKDAIRAEMEKDGKEMRKELDELLDW